MFVGLTATNASDLNRQQRVEKSSQWNGSTFQNPEWVPDVEWGPSLKMFGNYFLKKSDKFIPDPPLPAEPFKISQWDGKRDLQFAWLGHTALRQRSQLSRRGAWLRASGSGSEGVSPVDSLRDGGACGAAQHPQRQQEEVQEADGLLRGRAARRLAAVGDV